MLEAWLYEIKHGIAECVPIVGAIAVGMLVVAEVKCGDLLWFGCFCEY
jgi:hypothetical protein